MAGVDIAEVAAQAAVTTLSDVDDRASKGGLGSLARNTRQQGMNSNTFKPSSFLIVEIILCYSPVIRAVTLTVVL